MKFIEQKSEHIFYWILCVLIKVINTMDSSTTVNQDKL